MTDALALLLRLNLAVGAAILAVLILRSSARRAFGVRVAYGLWLLPPLAAAAMLLPARVTTLVATASEGPGAGPARTTHTAVIEALSGGWRADPSALLTAVWLAGAAVALVRLASRQARFARALRSGRAGPAVIGVLRPRIVTPADFAERYSPRERQLILAHEAAHISRHDARINAVVALARCANWFNPLIHVFAHALRIDQELACDATVAETHPTGRRAYAEAMLKTQFARHPPPLGCAWPAPSRHPLAQRIAFLARQAPGPLARRTGPIAVAALALTGASLAWAARPAEVRVVFEDRTPASGVVSAPSAFAPPPSRATRSAPRRRIGRAPAPSPATADAPAAQADPIPVAETTPSLPPEGCGDDPAPAAGQGRLLPAGYFGPSRRIHSAARWSSVEPGSAVRVYATMTAPDGAPLITDLTAFGSQSLYRVGCIRRAESRYKLFTSVAQHGERLAVTVSVTPGRGRWGVGSVDLAPGETATVALPGGLAATVTAYLRAETPEEITEARQIPDGRRLVMVLHAPIDS